MAHTLPEEFLYDLRLVERHIARGLITRAQAEAYAAGKPDQADQSEVLNLDHLIRPPNKR